MIQKMKSKKKIKFLCFKTSFEKQSDHFSFPLKEEENKKKLLKNLLV